MSSPRSPYRSAGVPARAYQKKKRVLEPKGYRGSGEPGLFNAGHRWDTKCRGDLSTCRHCGKSKFAVEALKCKG